jgi:hypothetical protein
VGRLGAVPDGPFKLAPASTFVRESSPPGFEHNKVGDENPDMKSSGNKLIRLIALFKLLKSTLLIALGLSALHLVHRDVASVLQHWVAKLGLDPGNRYVERALQKFANLTPGKIKSLGAVSFIYAGLFLSQTKIVLIERHTFADAEGIAVKIDRARILLKNGTCEIRNR